MTALALLTASACCHATWNLLMKTVSTKGSAFIWLCGLLTLPVSVVLLVRSDDLAVTWWPALISMALHTLYAVTLQKAYGAADFATVYPISRGSAPVLVALATVSGWRVYAGALIVLPGVLVMDRLHRGRTLARGIALGLLVAACTAAYTLWDAYAIGTLHADLLAYLAVSNLAQVVVLSVLSRDRRAALGEWRRAIPVAILVPASYGLSLLALSYASVSAVAVGRTMNVVIGALLGFLVLHERATRTRLAGLAAVVAGVVLVSI
ncbi:EamA family transporter [Kribbella sp. NPDC056951]|uniref:EamA family transporter n=1 Tax=Kribbella sp. NPDC056951 TaxID=3345978 RepID=UPI00362A9CA1